MLALAADPEPREEPVATPAPAAAVDPAPLPPPPAPAKPAAVPERHYTTWSSRSLIFKHDVERDVFHFQIMFGIGGGPDSRGLFHAMELGGTFNNGIVLGLLHTFVQNKGIMGKDVPGEPDLIGGWMLETKIPILFPEFEVKFAAGLAGLHDQSNGIRAIPGGGFAYGFDFHLPFFTSSGMTFSLTFLHAFIPKHYFTASFGVGYTFF